MIAFNRYYNHFNILSISLVVISLLLLVFKGLNFGIDFKGGTLIELRASDNKINVSTLRDNLKQMNLGDVSVKNFGEDTDFFLMSRGIFCGVLSSSKLAAHERVRTIINKI